LENSSLTPGEVDIWDVHSERLVVTPERASGNIVSVAYSPDGRSIVAAADSPFGAGEIVLLNASADGSYRSVYKSRKHVRQVAWSPNGSVFASIGAEPVVRIWNSQTLECIRTIQLASDAAAVAFEGDGTRLAVGCRSPSGSVAPGLVAVYNVADGRCIWSSRAHGNGVETVSFAPHGNLLASAGNDGAICLWEATTGRLLRRETAHSGQINTLAFAPAGSTFASAETRQKESGAIHEIVIRDASTAKAIRTIPDVPDTIQALAYSPGGSVLASGGRDGSIRLWRLSR
jgi:WD40 repeat protein